MIFKWMFVICQTSFVPKKLKTFVENRLEIKMKMIFTDFSPKDVRQQFFIKRLEYSESNHETSALARWKMLMVVLRCRGLLRTLLFLRPLPGKGIPSNLHALRRMDIFRTLIVHRVEFFNLTITKLKIVHPSPDDLVDTAQINEIARFNLRELKTHQGEKHLFFELQSGNGPVFGNKYPITLPKQEVFFYRLMHRDSQRIANFLLARQIQDISGQYLEGVYPQFRQSFDEFCSVSINVLTKFDELLELESTSDLQSGYQVLDDIQIWHQRFVISKKGLIVFDSTMHPRQEFVAGQWQFVKSFEKTTDTCLIKRPTDKTRHLESAIFLIGRCDENWYHFVIDTVPRILFTNDIPSNVPLIIRADIPENFKLVLSSLTERDIIEIELEENLEVQTLYVVPGRSSAFDSQPPSGTSFVEFSPSVLNRIKTLLVVPAIELDLNRHMYPYPEKIALSRSSTTRNVQNWFSLKSLIEGFGFAIHDLNPDFFKNQIAAFARAKIVVSPGGAAVANVIFMPLGSSIVVLRSYRNKDLRLWIKLASAMKVNCIEVTGIPTYFGPGKLRRMHSDFYISPRKLRKVLASVTASIT